MSAASNSASRPTAHCRTCSACRTSSARKRASRPRSMGVGKRPALILRHKVAREILASAQTSFVVIRVTDSTMLLIARSSPLALSARFPLQKEVPRESDGRSPESDVRPNRAARHFSFWCNYKDLWCLLVFRKVDQLYWRSSRSALKTLKAVRLWELRPPHVAPIRLDKSDSRANSNPSPRSCARL